MPNPNPPRPPKGVQPAHLVGKGGRKPGSLNKRKQEMLDEVAATGETPLQFMIRVMRDRKKPLEARLDAAKSAAPYVHSKMPVALQVDGDINFIPPYTPNRDELPGDEELDEHMEHPE